MPRNMAEYAHGNSSMIDEQPNGQTLALDAATAANADVDFGPYDNDGNGFVDAFIVVHAGPGAEVTLDGGDIWSHKWTLPDEPLDADGTKIFALPHGPRGLQDRRLRPRAWAPAVRLARPVRHRRLVGGPRGLVPHGGRQLERRQRRHPGASLRMVQGGAGLGHRREPDREGDGRRQGRQGRLHGVPALEARRGQPGVLPGREPPEGGLRQGAAVGRAARLPHRRRTGQQLGRDPLQGRPGAG